MNTLTPPAVSEAMREAEALVDSICAKLGYGTRLVSLRWAVASEIARLTGERDAAREKERLWIETLLLAQEARIAAEAETARLRAALKLAENPLSYRHATDPSGPGSIAVARTLEAVRAALTRQEQADG